ncbi:MAG TPA: BlaI/MecI/CopY family transcriptional regulator [Lachnospiraceae bacterium]|nr:BlaI/MecI/CopY family transcriptional regulator [Lachnospiraceae bacterium]
MSVPRINNSEYRFCEILWDNEPVSSAELVRLCNEKLEWKKSTTYTVIRRLTDRGVIRSENTIVTSIISREEARRAESVELIDKSFGGSLAGFVAAFAESRELSEKDIREIQSLIDAYNRK